MGAIGTASLGGEVVDDRPLRHGHLQRFATPSVLILALAVHTVGGASMGMIAKREQRGDVAIGDEPHVATLSPIATVRATECHRPLPAEGDHAGTTVTAAHVELGLVDEPAHRTS